MICRAPDLDCVEHLSNHRGMAFPSTFVRGLALIALCLVWTPLGCGEEKLPIPTCETACETFEGYEAPTCDTAQSLANDCASNPVTIGATCEQACYECYVDVAETHCD